MMLHPSTQKLIDRLATMSAQNKIEWTENENGDVIFATEGYIVRVSEEPPQMVLGTEGGKVLEDATPDMLRATPQKDGGSNYADLVSTLIRNARRTARGTEEAISTLLAGLADAPAPTPPKTGIPDRKSTHAGFSYDEDDSDIADEADDTEDEDEADAAMFYDAPVEGDIEDALDADTDDAPQRGADTLSETGTSGNTLDDMEMPQPAYTVAPGDSATLPEAPDATAPEAAAPLPDEEAEAQADEADTFQYVPFPYGKAPEPAEAASRPKETPETQAPLAADTAPAPRYVPFGAGGLETAGAEASAEESADAPASSSDESQLGAAATMMTLPDTEAEEKEAGPDADGVSLSQLGAGHGFGSPAGGYRPAESVSKASAFIDATTDTSREAREAPTVSVPDITNLKADALNEDVHSYVGTQLPQNPSDEVSPNAASASSKNEEAGDDEDDTSASGSERPRPKTRFNPWT
ncbi:hypothetical protein [Henriciella sp.]|uniref:hypothetical protein n=1 Tax=Henriciella sp. TaxID=1968823 RepID=UPI002634F5F2|nr:hypothetical protein [Henriciella sp.]